ncbi:MAG: LPS export ABC transporter permease LptG [Bradyrhizobiaceae bacterium]|nr:LPS export ABC transporter permease LptG [Bradyrhizobiaceae bacterium]
MIAFGTLGRYFGRRFLGAVAMVFFSCVGLIALVDFLELTRRFGHRPDASFTSLAYLVFLRLPAFTEQLLPFAVLLGAMGTFLTFSRRLEFVIARSAGMSVWQFTGSSAAVALTIGIFAVTVYNPLSAAMKEQANLVEASMLNQRGATLFQSAGRDIWVRQQSVDGQSILQAQATAEGGRQLRRVKIFSFDRTGKFIERVEAPSATLEEGNWVLRGAKVFNAQAEPQEYDTYLVSTNLTLEQVRGRLASPDSLSFWNLPEAIEATERAGLRTERYRLQYQVLLARPLLLIAMVVIAAVVSLRMFRFGGVGKMIVSGVVAGFLLYVVSRLAEELGEGGIIHPVAAAWFPAVFGSLMGCLVLLYQEDG